MLSDSELRAVWERAEGYGYPFGAIVKLLILTGQRRSEISNLRRSWVEGDIVTFPSEFVRSSREHVLPIGAMAKTIIEGLPERADLLFPSRLNDEKPFNGLSRSKRTFDSEIDIEPSLYTIYAARLAA